MAELAGGSGGVSFGSLYPALNRLELAGAVRPIDHARPRLVASVTGAIGAGWRPCATSANRRRASRSPAGATRSVTARSMASPTRARPASASCSSTLTPPTTVPSTCRSRSAASSNQAPGSLFERRRTRLTTGWRSAVGPRPSDHRPYLRSLRRDIALTDVWAG